ncbi:MAG TPA: bifunctional precorrin-2 dehydrogenase/sirohydrochlorin ferrochelatase [Candidatus Sphingobacterium stercoripullorum]|uniref:precorrin-2 dehydrogenase n=1 Tax=Candidatus Sphingobacterium stercoripullorum TaxID=2838759 RepID=A0A9D1W992_9SPHI|nr:bifunctional precorrin-2 dehydrogenase/sirohydrochlorin ferrochelatase [Candidatus Sphingobacterium stercoripullorum]
MKPQENTLFPVFLKLENLHTLVVGGGNVGLEKISALLNNAPKAKVTLIGLTISEELKAYVQPFPNVKLLEKAFSANDLDGIDLVIVGTNSTKINQAIHAQAKEKGLLVNVADTPHICDFYLGSIVQKGNLKIAISTNGQSPTLAKRMRELLTEVLPDEIHNVLYNLRSIRDSMKGDFAYKMKKLNEITSVFVEDKK